MADYTAAAKAAIRAKKGRLRSVPQPAHTAGRPIVAPRPTAGPTMTRKTPAGPTMSRKTPAPLPPRAAAPRIAAPSVAPSPRSAVAARASAAAPASTNTGPYAGALDQLDTEGRQISDVERRRLADNRSYEEWLNAGNAKSAGELRMSSAEQQARSSKIQTQTSAAQAQIQTTLDAQRAERPGTVTAGPGNSRARLAGDDTLTQSLLAGEQQRASITAQSSADKQGFLKAATAATAGANAARIRGEAGTQLADVGRRKGELLVHSEDTLSAERAATAAAAADAIKAQLDADLANRSIDARLSIAEATIGQRASDNAAQRALTAQQGRANRRTRRELSRAAARGKGGVSDAERRQRADDARKLDDDIARATSAAKAMIAGAERKGKRVPDEDTLRAGILATYPNISADALDAAVAAAQPLINPATAGGASGLLDQIAGVLNGTSPRQRAEERRKKARQRRLEGRG